MASRSERNQFKAVHRSRYGYLSPGSIRVGTKGAGSRSRDWFDDAYNPPRSR